MLSLSTTRQREETTDDNSTTTKDNNHPTKKVKREESKQKEEVDKSPPLQPLLLFNRKDIWIANILPFLGVGNYIFIAGVCKDMKVIYQDYYSSEEKKDKLPKVRYFSNDRKALVTDTFHREAFASLSRAKYWDENTKQGRLDRLQEDYICFKIAKYGNVPTMEWAREQRSFPWYADTCSEAARAGSMKMLKYAHENGCPWDDMTCSAAAGAGRLDILRYARGHGCPWDDMTCSAAAGAGRSDVLQWLHENGCPWDEYTCSVAAGGGHMHILQYAHDNGCPWDSRTLVFAIHNGHQEIVEYARANGCPEPPPNENDN